VVVTTPQDVRSADAIKAKTMFDKVNIPVLGFVENMSGFICPNCKHETDIFSKGGAEPGSGKLGVPFLAGCPSTRPSAPAATRRPWWRPTGSGSPGAHRIARTSRTASRSPT